MPDTTEPSTNLDQLRTEHEAARLRFETQQLERASRPPLLEAWGDLVVKPRGFDDQVPSTFVHDSRIYDRTDGKFLPVYETEQDLRRIRGQARNLITLTSVRTGALETLANYTFGTATQFKAQSKQKQLAEVIQTFIDQLADVNDFTGGDEAIDRETNRRSREDGDAFLYLADAPDGIPRIRFIEPDQVTQPADSRPIEDHYGFDQFPSCWKFGVHTPANMTDQTLGFHVVYDGVGNDWDYIPVSRMQHIKRNVTRNAKRGISDFYEVLSDIVNESRLRGSMLSGATSQAAIAWIMKPPTGSTHAQVTGLMNAASNALYSYEKNTASGSATQYVKQYKGNTFLGVAPGQEYAEMPGSNRNAGFQIVGQYALRAIGIRWSMPEYMISGDASNAAYASTIVAESPFVKAREADQGFYRRHFLELLWKALKIAYESGRFDRLGLAWQDIYAGVDITCDMPAVATRDMLKLAQTQEVQIRLGILSERTAATQAGLDIDAERKEGAKPAAPAASPFGPAPGVPGAPSHFEQAAESLAEDCGTGAGGFKAGNDCAAGGGGGGSTGKHDVKLPTDPKRLKLDQSNAALKQMGFKPGKIATANIGGKFVTTQELEFPDGNRKRLPMKDVVKIVYGGQNKSAKTQTVFPRTAESLSREQSAESLAECGGPGSGIPGPCPTGRAERMRTGRKPKSARAVLALKSHKPSTKAKQDHGVKNEATLAARLGGKSLPDNEPPDVLVNIGGKTHAVEVKTIVDNKNNKITMHPESRRRKEAYSKKMRQPFHTVIIDDRASFDGGKNKSQYSGNRLYYKRGTGAFRLGSAVPARNEAHLKQLMSMPDSAFAGGK